MSTRPNILFLLSDTHNQDMIGAYGNAAVGTPHFDRLAAAGTRFERAYSTFPVCTPARGALFSGIYPQLNGANYNGTSLHSHLPHAGEIFQRNGYRTAHSGKWHLDGDYPYMGSGEPARGFEPQWWYDGQNYRQDIGEDLYHRCYAGKVMERLDDMPEDPSCYWGHRVASKAIDFLDQVGNDPFFLVASFDEPHGPYCAPPSYIRNVDPADFPPAPTYNNLGSNKPRMQQLAADSFGTCPPADRDNAIRAYAGCTRFLDDQIGRILTRLTELGLDENTIIVYTTDHGHCQADYRLWTKAFWMYERTIKVPFLMAGPGIAQGAVTQSIVSHIDLLPTLLEAAGISRDNPLLAQGCITIDCPEERLPEEHLWIDRFQGVSLSPILRDATATVRDYAHVCFDRFGNLPKRGHFGNFYPVRGLVGADHKLILNALDEDEFYDLHEDPWELDNQILAKRHRPTRDHMHDIILDHMDDITDPLRCHLWGQRSWRSVRNFGSPWA